MTGVGWQMDASPECQVWPEIEPWPFVFSEWRAIPESLHISLESVREKEHMKGGGQKGGSLGSRGVMRK